MFHVPSQYCAVEHWPPAQYVFPTGSSVKQSVQSNLASEAIAGRGAANAALMLSNAAQHANTVRFMCILQMWKC